MDAGKNAPHRRAWCCDIAYLGCSSRRYAEGKWADALLPRPIHIYVYGWL